MKEIPDFSGKESTPEEVSAAEVVEAVGNPYALMVDEARSNLRRIMHGTDNQKLSKEIALEILDRAGETKKSEWGETVNDVKLRISIYSQKLKSYRPKYLAPSNYAIMIVYKS